MLFIASGFFSKCGNRTADADLGLCSRFVETYCGEDVGPLSSPLFNSEFYL